MPFIAIFINYCLKDRTGSSRQAIAKYVCANYQVDADKAAFHLRRALKKGLEDGVFKTARQSGKGAGSFRLVEKKKKPVVKKVKPSSKKSAVDAAKKAKSSAKKKPAVKAVAAKKSKAGKKSGTSKAKSVSKKPKVGKKPVKTSKKA